MSTPANARDARRRWYGCFFLFVAGGLLIWGQTILRPYLGRGIGFLIYWTVCLGFTMSAILVAMVDFWVVRWRAVRERRELLEETVLEVLPRDLRPQDASEGDKTSASQP